MKEVQVKVPGHSYTIKLGSGVIKELPAELKRLNPSSCLIATNITVGSLYLKKATDLCNGMCRTESVVLPDGEAYKDWGSVSAILEKLASMGADRKSVVIALGGGVTVCNLSAKFVQMIPSLISYLFMTSGNFLFLQFIIMTSSYAS